MDKKGSKGGNLKDRWGARLGLSRKQQPAESTVAINKLQKLPVRAEGKSFGRRAMKRTMCRINSPAGLRRKPGNAFAHRRLHSSKGAEIDEVQKRNFTSKLVRLCHGNKYLPY